MLLSRLFTRHTPLGLVIGSASLCSLPTGGSVLHCCFLDWPSVCACLHPRGVAQVSVRLGLMALGVKHLHVAVVVRSTVGQCDDVIELESRRVDGYQLAHSAARVGQPDALSLLLELAASLALYDWRLWRCCLRGRHHLEARLQCLEFHAPIRSRILLSSVRLSAASWASASRVLMASLAAVPG